MVRTVVMFLGLTVLSLGCGMEETTEQPAQEAQAEEKSERSLYDRLGGVYNIATVVDDLIERLSVDEILNANPAIKEARDRVPKAGPNSTSRPWFAKKPADPRNTLGAQ